MDDLICPLCNKQYNLEIKIPRLFPNCGHTFCSECIITIIEKDKYDIYCPEDGIKCDFYKERLGVNSFPLNFALQKLIKKSITKPIKEKPKPKINYDNRNNSRISDFSGVNYCMEHQKIAELICQKEKVIICTDCVLFGDHKSHIYLKIIEFKKESKNKILELEKNFDKLKKQEDFELVKSYEKQKKFLTNKVSETKEFLIANIKEKFSTIIEELKNREKDLTENLDSEFYRFNDTIKFLTSNSQKISKKQLKFEKNLKELKIQISQKNPNFELLLEKLHSEKSLNNLHKEISEDYKIHLQNTNKLIDKELVKYEIKGDTEKINDFLQNELKIKTGKEFQNEEIKNNKSINSEKDDKTRFLSPEREKSKQISGKSGGFVISGVSEKSDDIISGLSDKSGISGISKINQDLSSDDGGSNEISLIDGDLSNELEDDEDFMNLSSNLKRKKKKIDLSKNESLKKLKKNTSFLKKNKQNMRKMKTNLDIMKASKNNILGNLYKRNDIEPQNYNKSQNFVNNNYKFTETFGNNNYSNSNKNSQKSLLKTVPNKSLYHTSINDLKNSQKLNNNSIYKSSVNDYNNETNWHKKNPEFNNYNPNKSLYKSHTMDLNNEINLKSKLLKLSKKSTISQQKSYPSSSLKFSTRFNRNKSQKSQKSDKKKKFEKNFSSKNITDNNLVSILRQIEKERIRILDFSDNRITELGFEMILKKLYNHKYLREINLSGNYLDDKVFRYLDVYARKFKKLKRFYFSGNRFKSHTKAKIMAKAFAKYNIDIVF